MRRIRLGGVYEISVGNISFHEMSYSTNRFPDICHLIEAYPLTLPHYPLLPSFPKLSSLLPPTLLSLPLNYHSLIHPRYSLPPYIHLPFPTLSIFVTPSLLPVTITELDQRQTHYPHQNPTITTSTLSPHSFQSTITFSLTTQLPPPIPQTIMTFMNSVSSQLHFHSFIPVLSTYPNPPT